MKDFADKVLFITGGGSGAGLGQAKVFSEAGCKVVIADIRQDHLDEAVEYFRDKKATVHTIKMDITDRLAYEAAADAVDEVSAIQQAERVATALSELPDEQRKVIELAYLNDMPQSEIASKLALPLGTVKSRMRLAYGKLKTELEDVK